MPRRLGDDPLSRKRPPSTMEKDASSAARGLSTQQTSHNDVFFRRRLEGPPPGPEDSSDKESSLAEVTSIDERPEITEVSDIMRTAKADQNTQGAEQLAKAVPIDEPVLPQAEEPAEKTEQTPPQVPEPLPSIEPLPPVKQEPAAPISDQSESEQQPQKTEGFFKRLFGKFGK